MRPAPPLQICRNEPGDRVHFHCTGDITALGDRQDWLANPCVSQIVDEEHVALDDVGIRLDERAEMARCFLFAFDQDLDTDRELPARALIEAAC